MSCCMLPARRASPQREPQRSETKMEEQVILHIPEAHLTLLDSEVSFELSHGDFTILKLSQEDTPIAIIIKVGDDHKWPLTKDEPVVKLDDLHYLFSFRPPSVNRQKAEFISYGVKFCERNGMTDTLDRFLNENSCFSEPKARAVQQTADAGAAVGCWRSERRSEDDYWRNYAPKVGDYHGILAKAIASGTGEIVKGVFMCSNAYRSSVQNGGEVLSRDVKANAGSSSRKKGFARKGLKRVRRMTKMTEKLSQTLLDGVVMATGSVAAPMIRSQAGKKFLSMMPGEVLLVSLDAVNKVLEAAEVAGKDALSATAGATTRVVSHRFGEDAGEVTDDVFATAGYALGTAWNLFKIRKAINPASKQSFSTAILQNAAKK